MQQNAPIVPMYPPQIPPASAPPPHLTYNGGPLIKSVQVFTGFVDTGGTSWNAGPLQNIAQNLNQFFGYIVTSPLIAQLQEYSDPQQPIGNGNYVGSAVVSPPGGGGGSNVLSDAQIRELLKNWIAHEPGFPQPTADTLYLLFFQPEVPVQAYGGRSCRDFCGYHADISGQIFYGVIPYPSCAACNSPGDAFTALTIISSHELCEAITDPVPVSGWYDNTHGEIGDICAWQTKQVGQYTVQLEWSNQNNACI